MSEPTGSGYAIALAQLALPPAWTEEALCAQIDQDGFFPYKGESTAAVKKTCSLCTVQRQCLAYAIENEEPHGIWGGLSPGQRKPLVVARREAEARICQLDDCEQPVPGDKRKRRYCSDACASRAASRRYDARKGLAS